MIGVVVDAEVTSELAELSDHGLSLKLSVRGIAVRITISPRLVGSLPSVSGYFRVVPMSKVRAFAGFDLAEILMLTASVAVIAAITFVF